MTFEPVPRAFRTVLFNMQVNGGKTVALARLVNAAVGDKPGFLFFDSSQGELSARINVLRGDSKGDRIPVVTLDWYFYETYPPELRRRPLVLKIDIEGREIEALRGAQR